MVVLKLPSVNEDSGKSVIEVDSIVRVELVRGRGFYKRKSIYVNLWILHLH